MNHHGWQRRQLALGLGALALGTAPWVRAQSEGRIVLGQSAPFSGPAAQRVLALAGHAEAG